MNEQAITLDSFFSIAEKAKSAKLRPILDSVGVVSALKEKVAVMGRGLKWPVPLDGLLEKIPGLLNIQLSDVLSTAWNKYRPLRKYTDLEKYPPSEIVFVSLAEHKIESVHRPYIEIVIDEAPWKKIDFQITVTMKLKGFVLKIQGGKIKEIRTGDLKGMGKITCEGMVLLEKETESVDLPGTIDLGEGIPIR
jgi:hypothetical protein